VFLVIIIIVIIIVIIITIAVTSRGSSQARNDDCGDEPNAYSHRLICYVQEAHLPQKQGASYAFLNSSVRGRRSRMGLAMVPLDRALLSPIDSNNFAICNGLAAICNANFDWGLRSQLNPPNLPFPLGTGAPVYNTVLLGTTPFLASIGFSRVHESGS